MGRTELTGSRNAGEGAGTGRMELADSWRAGGGAGAGMAELAGSRRPGGGTGARWRAEAWRRPRMCSGRERPLACLYRTGLDLIFVFKKKGQMSKLKN